MPYTLQELEDALLNIKAAIRVTPGCPASLDTEASAAVNWILEHHKRVLFACCRSKGISTQIKDIDIINTAYLYATQPPIVMNTEASIRKDRLRLQDWVDWLDTSSPSIESFVRRFTRWANIFATEYGKLVKRQGIDDVSVSYTPREESRPLKSETDSFIFENLPAPESDEDEEPRCLYPEAAQGLFVERILVDLNATDEKRVRIAALSVLLFYLSWEAVKEFQKVRAAVCKVCAALSGKSEEEVGAALDKMADSKRQNADLLATRRVNKDLPLLSYPEILPLLGADPSPSSRHYTAIHRYRTELKSWVLRQVSESNDTGDID